MSLKAQPTKVVTGPSKWLGAFFVPTSCILCYQTRLALAAAVGTLIGSAPVFVCIGLFFVAIKYLIKLFPPEPDAGETGIEKAAREAGKK